MILSMVMLVILLAGVYSAYKQFSGLDPLKLDPQSVISNVVLPKLPPKLTEIFSSVKIPQLITKKDTNILGEQSNTQATQSPGENVNKNPLFKFLLIADSHNDNAGLDAAITQAKLQFSDLEFIIGLGDYTEVGTIEELKKAKTVFDNSSLRYFLIPGDHDLWDCRNRQLEPTACFRQVFGPDYQTFSFENIKFILLNNSDNYKGFDDDQLKWLAQELEKSNQEGIKKTFVFMHEPLYHPSADRIMGKVEKSLKPQALSLIFQLKEAGASQIFAGDIHFFSQYTEPKSGIMMFTVGAVTLERNPQVPRFGIVTVFDDGTAGLEDVEIR